MYLQEREAESKIKGNKKDLEKTGKLFECGRALDCKKPPCSPVGTCARLVCALQVQSQVRPFQPGLFPPPREQVHPGREVGMTTELEAAVKVGVGAISRLSWPHPREPSPACLPTVWWPTPCGGHAAGDTCPVCSWRSQPYSYCRSVLVAFLSPSSLWFSVFPGKGMYQRYRETWYRDHWVFSPLSNAWGQQWRP